MTSRGTSTCRGCESAELASVLDLGLQPLSNELITDPAEKPERFPLELKICSRCGLGQVGEYVLPERIFGDEYPYLSSTSTTWVAHARRYAQDLIAMLDLRPANLVLEVASNDGYLLSGFQQQGIRVLGIEPASNVADLARAAGVPTITAFFGEACARRVVADEGHPRLVAANNVMAHVPDLHDFVAGLAALCDADTLITVENPSLMSLLQETQFDTIYHEHFSYLTATSVRTLARSHGLELVRVETFPTHGGSNRYFLRLATAARPDHTVAELIGQEERDGLFSPSLWRAFEARSTQSITELRQWLEERRAVGARVAGYGAAAKGNTLLNAVGEAAGHLAFVVDASVQKQGKFLPGPQTPILEPGRLAIEDVDDVLILPWNLADELVPIIRSLSPSARIWVPRPHLQRLS